MTVQMAMRTFHGNPDVKANLLAQLRAHRAADEIIKGQYWEDGRGCAVGCCTHDPDGRHDLFPKLWGIPEEIARLMDAIFEGLPNDIAKDWPVRIIDAIPVGADLSLVIPRFLHWLLTDPDNGTMRLCDEQGRAATETVAALLRRRIAGDEPTTEEWGCAHGAAHAAAARAAYGVAARAAYGVAARAAWAAGAAGAAADAARAAASSAARAAAYGPHAYDAARRVQADELVRLCETAPVVTGASS